MDTSIGGLTNLVTDGSNWWWITWVLLLVRDSPCTQMALYREATQVSTQTHCSLEMGGWLLEDTIQIVMCAMQVLWLMNSPSGTAPWLSRRSRLCIACTSRILKNSFIKMSQNLLFQKVKWIDWLSFVPKLLKEHFVKPQIRDVRTINQ